MSSASRSAIERITSLTNERIKAVRALDQRKTRRETGLFVAEGAAIIQTARENGFVPELLLAGAGAFETSMGHELAHWARGAGADVLEVTDAILEKLAAKDNPQAMMAVYRQRWAEAPDPAATTPDATWVLLEEIRDPGNLGTIIRTADAAGAAGVILAGTCCDAWSRECVRATMGSIFAVPIARIDNDTAVALATQWPGARVATHLSAREDYRRAAYPGPVLLAMGREGPGLSETLAAVCTTRVKIPMAGRLDSLNLAVATALMLYQVRGDALKL